MLRDKVPHPQSLQRTMVGVATAHLEPPGQLPLALGGGGHDYRLTESTTTAICVILAWLTAGPPSAPRARLRAELAQ